MVKKKKDKYKGLKDRGLIPKGLKKVIPKHSATKVIQRMGREQGALVREGEEGYIKQEMIKEKIGWLD